MVHRMHKSKTDGIVWACNNKIGSGLYARDCNSSRSVRTNSGFSSPNWAFLKFYCIRTSGGPKFHKFMLKKIMDFFKNSCWLSNFCREVAIGAVFKNSEKIEGPGTVVKIDESKFGKRMVPTLYFMISIRFIFNIFINVSISAVSGLKGNWCLVA